MIYFITSNKNKLAEVRALLPETLQLDIDLPEIQELDSKKVIEAKMAEAFKHHSGPFMIEDTALHLDCLNGLPGPLIKFFEKALGGNAGLLNLVNKMGDNQAEAVVTIGYAKNGDEIKYFEGRVRGELVPERGKNDWAWGLIFKPEGCDKTFGEMEQKEKEIIKMRQIALKKLRNYLEEK
jgi:non-canonical purine NTP pyrophosphatase (RdgB/HAM1 family)